MARATGKTRLLQRRWVIVAIAQAVRAYVWLVMRTSRLSYDQPEAISAIQNSDKGFILVCSHGRILALAALHQKLGKGRKLYGLHSAHRDGQLVGEVVGRYRNIGTIQGSSTRGGAQAIRDISRAIVDERAIVLITPDGPKGPRLRNRSAVGEIARACDCPVIGFGVASRRGIFLNTWDRFLLLTPFDHLHIAVAEPFEASGSDREQARAQIEEILRSSTQSSDKLAHRTATTPG